MRLTIIAAAVAVVFANALATAALPAPPLKATGPWNVEFADKMCFLSRPYGKDLDTHLIFKPAMLGNGLEIIVTRETKHIGDAKTGNAVLAIAGKPSQAATYYSAYSTAKLRMLRLWIGEDAVSLGDLRGSVQIDAKSEGRYSFAIGGIESALPILSRCVDQLRVAYKISEADLAAIKTMPDADMPRLFSSNDYPVEALRARQAGTVGVLLWVDASGRVSTCEIVETSAAPILGETTCNVLKRRARFTPALDASGQAVRAPTFARIRWALPS